MLLFFGFLIIIFYFLTNKSDAQLFITQKYQTSIGRQNELTLCSHSSFIYLSVERYDSVQKLQR